MPLDPKARTMRSEYMLPRSLPSICTVTPGIWRRLSAADRLLKSIGRKSVFVKRVFLAFPRDIHDNKNSDHLEASVWSVT